MSEFVDSNGIKIAYDIQGSGPALVLLHGAGRTKKDWHTAGYVGRLEKDFSVVTIDLRGCGESNSAHQVEDFSIDHLTSDVQTVVEACEIETYSIWGYSLGGNIGRYLAARTNQVQALAIIGIPMDAAVHPAFDHFISEFIDKWTDYVTKVKSRSDMSKKSGPKAQIPTLYYLFQAMRGWPNLRADELRCPAMLLCGTRNEGVYGWVQRNRNELVHLG
jgi:pimeloyl-ACP methyl ester carboxylesterase